MSKRLNYIFKETGWFIILFILGSLFLTGIALIIGHIFNQNWVFAPGILILALFYYTIKKVIKTIKESKYI